MIDRRRRRSSKQPLIKLPCLNRKRRVEVSNSCKMNHLQPGRNRGLSNADDELSREQLLTGTTSLSIKLCTSILQLIANAA